MVANHVKYKYFCDGNVINNATLSLWKFSDFRGTIGTPGNDIMLAFLLQLLSLLLCYISTYSLVMLGSLDEVNQVSACRLHTE